MSIVSRSGILLTEQGKVPILDIIKEITEHRSMARITAKYPISESAVWDAMDAYSDAYIKSSLCQAAFTVFDYEDICDPGFGLETVILSQEMFVDVVRFGRLFVDDLYDLDRIYQVGMYFLVIEVLESIHATSSLEGLSSLHFSVLAALEESYSGSIGQDASVFLESMRSSSGFWHQDPESQGNLDDIYDNKADKKSSPGMSWGGHG